MTAACLRLILAASLVFIGQTSGADEAPPSRRQIPIPSWETNEIHERVRFKTEPTFWPETFNVTTIVKDRSRLAPGYLFIAPLFYNWGWGPQIYDIDGQLIWYGNSSVKTRVQDFKACDYLGSKLDHLCWHENKGYGASGGQHAKRVFDNTYNQVGPNFTHTSDLGGTIDGHEMNIIENGEYFLWPVGKRRTMDLTPYRGRRGGAVRDVCFQEVSMRNETAVFTWCFLDHFNVTESTLYFRALGQQNTTSPIAGGGMAFNPWDFLHMNSIDKNSENDYLMSGRHTDQIMKIAGNNNAHGVEPGTVLWRLGGHHSDFKKTNAFLFTKQHSVRYVSTTANETVFTILDNAWEGYNVPSARYSSGMEIAVNNVTMEATLRRQWIHPDSKVTRAQGNLQNLPNGNVLLEWGARRELTEYSRDGKVLYHLRYDNGFGEGARRGRATYRGFKFPWVGMPQTKPKLLAYCGSCVASGSSPLLAYVSWNGATEVAAWRFETANDRIGPWIQAGTHNKTGFETRVELSASWGIRYFSRYVSVEALAANGTVLASNTAETFVPDAETAEICDADGCSPETGFTYPKKLSRAASCKRTPIIGIFGILLGIMLVESLTVVGSLCSYATVEEDVAYFQVRRPAAVDLDLESARPLVKEKLPV